MKGTLRIHSGKFRGKKLKFPPDAKGKSHFTPALIKEALFPLAMNEPWKEGLEDRTFFDLCAGSGQMAWEACSLGYGEVHLCEVDEKRIRFLIEEMEKNHFQAKLHRRDFRRMAPLIGEHREVVAFLDPPYSFWDREDGSSAIDRLLEQLLLHPTLHSGPVLDQRASLSLRKWKLERLLLIIQGPASYVPRFDSEKSPRLPAVEREVRDYRGNFLTLLFIDYSDTE